MRIFKVFETISEVIGWLQIVASFTLIGIAIGALLYSWKTNTSMLIIGICIALFAFVFAIIYASRIWKKKGTIWLMSRMSASPELDNIENEEGKQ